MSIESSRTIQVLFSGDITEQIIQSALENEVSPAITDIITLDIGPNTIGNPALTGFVATGLTIIPPAANTSLITLKGVDTDIGIPLHLTDPTSISLDPTFSELILDAAAEIVGVRLVWS